MPCSYSTLDKHNNKFNYDISEVKFSKDISLPFIDLYSSIGGLNILLNINGNYSRFDEYICQHAICKWSQIINSMHNIKLNISFLELEKNVLGSAGPTHFKNVNDKWFVTEGVVNLNTLYWEKEKQLLKYDNKTSAFYTLLHEIGHVLGIGTLWLDHNLLSNGPYYNDKQYWNSDYTNALYIGENGLREYKEHLLLKTDIPEHLILGIPVEDNGGTGTKGGHIEEGDMNHEDRYYHGIKHMGLDNELMTGYSENSPEPEPLSRITIGMLEDLGYDVNYKKADLF